MLQLVYERVSLARYLTNVIIATDDQRICDEARGFGAPVRMTSRDHLSGTDRVAEVASSETAEWVVNVQGDEPLIDPNAIDVALNTMKKGKNPRKALLIISDGGDNSSRYTESEVKGRVREADVQIYAIGIFEPVASRGRTPEEMSGPSLLSEVAEQTGGRHFPVDNLNELPDVAAKIGVELRNQYILGYTPSNLERDGKYRKVQVKLVQPRGLPPLRASWRLGYYAPTQ